VSGCGRELPRAAAAVRDFAEEGIARSARCRGADTWGGDAPGYGEGNHYVYGELLGMSSREIKGLAEEDVI